MYIDYLRISVTDRCNLRCIYCNPLGSCGLVDRDEVLTFEEICRIVRLFAECGVSRVRLTGGEPLVRKNITFLIEKLASITAVTEITLTTNGVLLEQSAEELKTAGLNRVNVSVDSLDRGRYKFITGCDLLEDVKKGIRRSMEIGLTPVKINTVVLRGINEQDIIALAQLTLEMPAAVRFIEYCPTDKDDEPDEFFVPNSRVRRNIEDRFGSLTAAAITGGGPAEYFKIKDSAGCMGFISGRSAFFCTSCNRLRLTSDGKVKPCLYSAATYDVKKLIRNGADDGQVLNFLRKIIDNKGSFTRLNSFAEGFSMCSVGG